MPPSRRLWARKINGLIPFCAFVSNIHAKGYLKKFIWYFARLTERSILPILVNPVRFEKFVPDLKVNQAHEYEQGL